MSAPKAIILKGQVIIFDNRDRAAITSVAASYAYHNQSDFKIECYNAAREYALKHYCHLLPKETQIMTYEILVDNQVIQTHHMSDYYRTYYNIDTAIKAETKNIRNYVWATENRYPGSVVSMACKLP